MKLESRPRIALAVVLLGTGGCYHSFIDLGDGDGDVDARTDVDGEVDVGDEADADIDAAPDGDADGTTCPGWYDPTSGLCWRGLPDESRRGLDAAVAYCDGLASGGLGGWHVPTISELRSLVRGCPSIETGGTCGVADSSPDLAGWGYDRCGDCSVADRPGTSRCFWPEDVSGACNWYWSRTEVPGSGRFWFVAFSDGFVSYVGSEFGLRVRCVRPGP